MNDPAQRHKNRCLSATLPAPAQAVLSPCRHSASLRRPKSDRLLGKPAGEAVRDPLRHVHLDLRNRCSHRLGKALAVGAAVALDDYARQANQTRAVVELRIVCVENPAQTVVRLLASVSRGGGSAATQFLAQHMRRHLCRAFGSLECDVAGEALGDDHVGSAGEQFVGLDVADVANAVVVFKQPRCSPDVGRSLVELGADVEQCDARRRDVGAGLGQGGAHVRELVQLFGPCLEACAKVEQPHGAAGGVGKALGDGGAVHSLGHADQMPGKGHQGTGAAGTHEGVAGAGGDAFDHRAHGRGNGATQGVAQRVGHVEGARRGGDGVALAVVGTTAEGGTYRFGLADQVEADVGARRHRVEGAIDQHGSVGIGTEGVDGYAERASWFRAYGKLRRPRAWARQAPVADGPWWVGGLAYPPVSTTRRPR